MKKYKNKEFTEIIKPILNIDEFYELKKISHHGITRYNHSLRVAYYTYLITKKLHLNYKEATIAALLHDFFTDEVADELSVFKLRRHPNHALENASKYIKLSDMQKDIIKTHMFPVTFTPPKYTESWIVDIIDDCASIYERSYTIKKQLSAAGTFLLLIVVNFLKYR